MLRINNISYINNHTHTHIYINNTNNNKVQPSIRILLSRGLNLVKLKNKQRNPKNIM